MSVVSQSFYFFICIFDVVNLYESAFFIVVSFFVRQEERINATVNLSAVLATHQRLTSSSMVNLFRPPRWVPKCVPKSPQSSFHESVCFNFCSLFWISIHLSTVL